VAAWLLFHKQESCEVPQANKGQDGDWKIGQFATRTIQYYILLRIVIINFESFAWQKADN
jgi:hypothetical protein